MTEGVQWSQTKAARKIAALLASAEDAAKRGALGERDVFLQRATALQHKYAVDQVMLEAQGEQTEDIDWADFCQESNTPLVKAKRQLIAGIAELYRGYAVMMSEEQLVKGKWKVNKRAKIRVWAHASDLAFISQLYTSLILQMQTEMARDESFRTETTNGWRVSYAHAWAHRVYNRLWSLQKNEEADSVPGAALMLRSKGEIVKEHAKGSLSGKIRNSKMRVDAKDQDGIAAGDAAGRRADLGQQRLRDTTRALD